MHPRDQMSTACAASPRHERTSFSSAWTGTLHRTASSDQSTAAVAATKDSESAWWAPLMGAQLHLRQWD